MTTAVPVSDLAARTLQLVDVPSESRSEAVLVDLVAAMKAHIDNYTSSAAFD